MAKQILIVSNNKNKAKEICQIFADIDLEVLTLNDFAPLEIEETGRTFFENALLKATVAANKFSVIALGEDSGLIVDWLNGKPGVFSRRFAGENASDQQNNQLLLKMLEGVPFEKRTAHFVSNVVIAKPYSDYISAEGVVDGYISESPSGINGFGYDPIFFYPPLKRTFAELMDYEKNEISHRKKALEKIKLKLYRFLRLDD